MEGSNSRSSISSQRRVGLLYDERMCKHFTPDGEDHPESPHRIRAIWKKLHTAGIPQRCVVLNAREADDRHLLSVHSRHHVDLVRNISSKEFDSLSGVARIFNSIYLNEGSSEAAYLAAGSVIEVAEKVARGELCSAFAIVRPPGHHAEQDEPMGFCLYNNVAVATSFLLNERPKLGVNKILIVDWDVHHGNGTQKMFWKDSRVLFFSVHRHEFGTFYPANDDGYYTMIGEGPGAGFNINVPWENGRCGDADYLAVWDHILIPVAKDFDPDVIMISAGFDAAVGDPLGGCRVTPYGYSLMLKKLMDFANGKIIMALEGGYNLESLANSVLACVEVLLEDKPIIGTSETCPFESTWRVIQMVRQELSAFWPTLADELPKKLTSSKVTPVKALPLATPVQYISSSDSESESDKSQSTVSAHVEEAVQDLIKPLLDMKVVENNHDQVATIHIPWRSELSKVDIWYATYGSNMLKSRFLCYIEGGQVEGMRKQYSGSMNKSPPKEILWKIVSHRLFFGHNHTPTWGPGGVAFLCPDSDQEDKAFVCLYRITLEQFNDVLLQENAAACNTTSPFFGLTALDSVANNKSISIEDLKGWYHNVLYLGKERDIPIVTMTCSLLDIENFKSGKIPLCGPCREYANVLVKGLVEGKQLSEDGAKAYIEEAYSKPL
ncbi:histone deacetylase 5-like [Malania oleifera]|uniref:histone deacetylase 5-like n=1 Tax=Malania oleifera TaxID=397392 RepID=UPI0025AECC82|nr:histone deacetylase 5-like [Malania oleifera]